VTLETACLGRICERLSISDDQTAASPRQEPTPRGDELPVRSGRGSVASARPVLLAQGDAGVTASRVVAPAWDDLEKHGEGVSTPAYLSQRLQ
jgi:hypothetical protein